MVQQFILHAHGEMEPNGTFARIFPTTFTTKEEALAQRFEFARQMLVDASKDESFRDLFHTTDLQDISNGYLFEGETVGWWTNNDWFFIEVSPVQITDADKVGNVSLLVLTSTLREKYGKIISERLKSCQMFAMQFDAHSCYEKSIEIIGIGVLEEVKLDSKEHVVIVISSSAYHIGDLNMAQLSQVFEVIKNRQPRYMWTAKSNDGSYDVTSDETFATRKECYENMRRAALMKAEWNTEWEDFGEPDEDSCIGYDFEFQRDRIVHTSYSGTYTYQIVPC